MAKKTIGYVELEWTCANCGNKNPGLEKTCGSCGSPQPQNVQFELGNNQDLLVDEQKTVVAALGPDIHCPYCGTRNRSDAQLCIQCGGDLNDGLRRQGGRVLSSAPVAFNASQACPNCGTINTGQNHQCSACGASLAVQAKGVAPIAKQSPLRPWMVLPVFGIVMICCVVIGLLFFRTSAETGVVQNSQWQRVIEIEEQRQVTKETWQDQLPVGAEVVSCQQEYRRRDENPVAGAREVCATELIDKGNGAAEIVESCFYEVYEDYCKYLALEWQTVNQAQAQGSDYLPYWPQVSLIDNRREGDRTENYTIYFETEDGIKQFDTSNEALYVQLQPGTQWTLTINSLGAIVEVSP